MEKEHVEDLLPRYIEGDLTADENRAVDEHLSSCRACREALGTYGALEQALIALRRERPTPKKAYTRIERRLPLTPAFSPASILRSPAVVGTAAVVLMAILAILFREQLGIALSDFGNLSSGSLTSSLEVLPQWIATFVRGDAWLLALVVAAEMLLFSLATGIVVLRMIRH